MFDYFYIVLFHVFLVKISKSSLNQMEVTAGPTTMYYLHIPRIMQVLVYMKI